MIHAFLESILKGTLGPQALVVSHTTLGALSCACLGIRDAPEQILDFIRRRSHRHLALSLEMPAKLHHLFAIVLVPWWYLLHDSLVAGFEYGGGEGDVRMWA